jgi:hypothetical protein
MASPGCSGVAGAEKAELDEVVEAKKDEVRVLDSSSV